MASYRYGPFAPPRTLVISNDLTDDFQKSLCCENDTAISDADGKLTEQVATLLRESVSCRTCGDVSQYSASDLFREPNDSYLPPVDRHDCALS